MFREASTLPNYTSFVTWRCINLRQILVLGLIGLFSISIIIIISLRHCLNYDIPNSIQIIYFRHISIQKTCYQISHENKTHSISNTDDSVIKIVLAVAYSVALLNYVLAQSRYTLMLSCFINTFFQSRQRLFPFSCVRSTTKVILSINLYFIIC